MGTKKAKKPQRSALTLAGGKNLDTVHSRFNDARKRCHRGEGRGPVPRPARTKNLDSGFRRNDGSDVFCVKSHAST